MKNLTIIYRKITDNQIITQGLQWYKEANELCQKLAEKYSLPVSKVVGVFSALSPGTNFEQNKRDAEAIISGKSGHKCTTYGANVAKARAILASDKDPTKNY